MASEDEPLSSMPNRGDRVLEKWTFDDIFASLGEFGRYQKCLYFLCSAVYTVTSMQLLGWVFVGAVPDHSCDCNSTPPSLHAGQLVNTDMGACERDII